MQKEKKEKGGNDDIGAIQSRPVTAASQEGSGRKKRKDPFFLFLAPGVPNSRYIRLRRCLCVDVRPCVCCVCGAEGSRTGAAAGGRRLAITATDDLCATKTEAAARRDDRHRVLIANCQKRLGRRP